MNDLLLIPVIFLAVGGILILLWRLFLIASGLFLIGFVSFSYFRRGLWNLFCSLLNRLYTLMISDNMG